MVVAAGLEPATSPMSRERATNCAKRPLGKKGHLKRGLQVPSRLLPGAEGLLAPEPYGDTPALRLRFEHRVLYGGALEKDESSQARLHVFGFARRVEYREFSAVGSLPVLVEIEDGRNRASVVALEAVDMSVVKASRRIRSEMRFEIVQSEEELTIQGHSKLLERREEVPCNGALLALDPTDLVAADVERGLRLLTTSHPGEFELASGMKGFAEFEDLESEGAVHPTRMNDPARTREFREIDRATFHRSNFRSARVSVKVSVVT